MISQQSYLAGTNELSTTDPRSYQSVNNIFIMELSETNVKPIVFSFHNTG